MKLLKSDKIALLKIRELTVDLGKIGTQITNDQFIQKGLFRRDVVIKSTNKLRDMGLVFKVKYDEHLFRYQLTELGKTIEV